MAAKGDFFGGIALQHHRHNLKLATGARAHQIFVKLKVQREGFPSGRVFDKRRVVDVTSGDARRVISQELVQVDLRYHPVGRSGRLAEVHGELRALIAVVRLHTGEIANGIMPIEHRAQWLRGSEAVFPFFEKNAESGDLGFGNFIGIYEIPGELEILFQNRLQKRIGDPQRIGEYRLRDRLAWSGRQREFLHGPLASLTVEVKENPVTAGFSLRQF